MTRSRTRLAIVLSLLMLVTPMTGAIVSPWDGPDVINSDGDPTVVTAFEVPGNATVMDGWLHVTNTPLSSSSKGAISWNEDDFNSGYPSGTEIDDNGNLVLQDDGTRSNVSNFDVGEIEVSLSSVYTYSPGWRAVYQKVDATNIADCGGNDGSYIIHGMDNDFDQSLDSDEIIGTLYYCETFANGDQISSLTIDNPGSGYIAANLSATGGGGSGFSGTYEISTGIGSITVNNGGSGYGTGDQVQINTNGDGTGAAASVGIVSGSGEILSMVVD
ncbi:MAG TPA: hypothetical protein QF641_03190, partial [Candidatus Thalassarchaeaceae archaeon]|nr:hypothetical protein [Candidatus Thalassarchaeaceae archaeon]